MSEDLVHKFNERFAREKVCHPNPTVLACSEEPFETSKIDWEEIPPRKDVPLDLQSTPIGKQAMTGYPALKGTVRKYWAKCAPPTNDPTAFDRSHEIIAGMPLEYNNVVWSLTRDGEDDFYTAATFFV